MRLVAAALVAMLLLTGCGDDTPEEPAAGSTTTTEVESTTTSEAATLTQPAVWPAPGAVFDTPEEAAADFVEEVLGVPPVLGDFQEGDSRSGEIAVYSPGEGDSGTRVLRGTLLMRMVGPDDGWFVIGAVNDNATIDDPESLEEVDAGPLEVSGRARGFEATVVVSAFVAGHADQVLDRQITQGGAFETPEPYSVTLDLSDAQPGATVALLVRGDTGLETDPGEFGIIPVVIGEA